MVIMIYVARQLFELVSLAGLENGLDVEAGDFSATRIVYQKKRNMGYQSVHWTAEETILSLELT